MKNAFEAVDNVDKELIWDLDFVAAPTVVIVVDLTSFILFLILILLVYGSGYCDLPAHK